MRKIIYTRPDGGLSVVHPALNTFGEAEGFTEAQAEQRAWLRLPVDAITPTFVEATAIPADRSKRRAWRQNGATIVVDAVVEAALKDSDAIAAIDGIDRLQFEHLFNLENRMRVLEAKPAITREQYKTALIAQWKALNP